MYRTLGTLVLTSSHYEPGTLIPAGELKENSTEAELFLFVETSLNNPHFHPELNQGLQTVMARAKDFGDRVQIGFTPETNGWTISFTPKGWQTPVKLGKIESLEFTPETNSDFYNLYTRAIVEISIDNLRKGDSLEIGRECSIPGLATVTTLSRKHCTIKRIAANKFKVVDHNSKNGTYVYSKKHGWRSVEARATLTGGTMICLGADQGAFQFILPEPKPLVYLSWKGTCVAQLAQLKSGQVISIIPPGRNGKPDKSNAFEIMREVVWSFIVHPLFRKNKILIPTTDRRSWDKITEDRSLPALVEIRPRTEKIPGFTLPNDAIAKIIRAYEGDVITLGAKDFETTCAEVADEHIAILIVERNNFMILNKSEVGAIYYRQESLTWRLLNETELLPAGTDIMLGIPGSNICFTLPVALSAGRFEA